MPVTGARGRARRILAALAALLALTGMLAGPGSAAAASAASAPACSSVTGGQPVSPGTVENVLDGVAVLSPCNVWAVGFDVGSGTFQTLIEHWDGMTWKQVPSPSPGTSGAGSFLNAVRAVSPTNIWAVGSYSSGTRSKVLIEHWNGTSWKKVPGIDPGTSDNGLNSVRPVSATNIWAVGSYSNANRPIGEDKTLIEHWNGTRWKKVPSPNPGPSNDLLSVAATAASNAWAVGRAGPVLAGPMRSAGTAGHAAASAGSQTLILRWNGTRWRRVVSPPAGSAGVLTGVGAMSAANAWAVGTNSESGGDRTLTLHWNGIRWKRVPSPSLGGTADDNRLESVTVLAAGNAWAVGTFQTSSLVTTLILHWNGARWTQVPSPNPGSDRNDLFAVGASSARNIWAVGAFTSGSLPRQAFAVHCCAVDCC